MGGLCQRAAGRAGAGARLSGPLYASGGDLQRAHPGHRRRHGECAGARLDPGQPQAHAQAGGGNFHRSLSTACAAQGFQAHSPLRADRPSQQSGETGPSARGALGALVAPAETAVTDPMPSPFFRRADGAGPRQGSARPFGTVRAIRAFVRACS